MNCTYELVPNPSITCPRVCVCHAYSACLCVFICATLTQVMQSLQKPKKITLTGSDGKDYPFLAKPKDDLRKDYRYVRTVSLDYLCMCVWVWVCVGRGARGGQ